MLRDLGIQVIGAGANIEEARKPAFVEKKGVTIGFLSYCSVLRQNYQAGETSAGAAPMRAYTHYLQHDYQPGTAPKILTFPYQDDLEATGRGHPGRQGAMRHPCPCRITGACTA